MRELVAQLLDHRLSRRSFMRRLAATGVAARAIDDVVASVEAAERTSAGDTAYRSLTGTGGELLVEQLRAAGHDYVFANPGSTETGFYDALVDAQGLQLIVGLHEGIVISMADGYHQASGKPAFVNVHAMVGTAQMSGQMYNAHFDYTPVVVTAGMSDPTVFSDDQSLAPRQGFNQSDVNRQFTKISWDVRNPASIPLAIRRALKVATTAPGGPVYLGIATPALNARNVTADIVDQAKFDVPMHVRPDPAQVEEAARWLLEAKRPFFMIGRLPLGANASARAVELADLLGVAVMANMTGFRDLDAGFPTSHPLFYDGSALGMWRRRAGENPLAACDLLVGLGQENFQGATLMVSAAGGEGNSPQPYLSRSARKVAIGLDAENMARTEPVDISMVADPEHALGELLDAVKSLATKDRLARIRADRYGAVTSEITAHRAKVEAQVKANFGKSPMHPEEVAMMVDRALDADAITVHENYSHESRSAYRTLLDYGPGRKTRVSPAGGSLGWGVGASIGAKLGQPDRQVVLQVGDGALMYSAAGFWTMARYHVPVLTVVYNNQNYQIVRFGFEGFGGKMAKSGKYPGLFLGDPAIDFPMLAKSQGVGGERVSTPADLNDALKRGIAATRAGDPYLIEVNISRTGPGAESTWHQEFSLAEKRTRRA